MKLVLTILALALAGCASKPKIQMVAPLNIPKPATNKSTDKVAEDLRRMRTTIQSAEKRAEKIKLLLDALDSQE
jgi:outer membrane murein-binding lipoprotein Lpp